MFRVIHATVAATLLLAISLTTNAFAIQYRIRDLGVIPGQSGYGTYVSDINESGQVVGYLPYACGAVWNTDGTMTIIPFTETDAINDCGQVVGSDMVDKSSNMGYSHARLWSSTGVQNIPELPGYSYGEASDINNQGVVVGSSYTGYPDWQYSAFKWTQNDGLVQLSNLYGCTGSAAYGINNLGYVVGYAKNGNSSFTACLWDPQGNVTSLGRLAGSSSNAEAINDTGQVVGSSTYSSLNYTHAFIWTMNSGMVDLGTTGGKESYASDINSSGQVVGTSFAANNIGLDAFFWSESTGMITLPGLSTGNNAEARAINDAGWIAGYANNGSGLHAVLWQPVPEPSCMVALLCGIGCICVRRKRL